MANVLRERVTRIKANVQEKKKLSGWVIPREDSAFGDADSWYLLSPLPHSGIETDENCV